MTEGINLDLAVWINANLSLDRSKIAAFPPPALMQVVSGLTDPLDFASHGCHLLLALSDASAKPLKVYKSILDFGVGSGRLARMFKGFHGRYVGVDADERLTTWVDQTLPFVEAVHTRPRQPIPLSSRSFDAAISVSVFTHINEVDQKFYLSELHRLAAEEATLFLTVHGERALYRSEREQQNKVCFLFRDPR
jgi:SAM-dependent methyltransferase